MINTRQKILFFVIASIVCTIFYKLYNIATVDYNFLSKHATNRITRKISIKEQRGTIYDRNLQPLAVSAKVMSVAINPTKFELDKKQLFALSQLLEINENKILTKQFMDKNFVYLKRHIDPDVALKIKQLNISGLIINEEYKRFYPQAEISAHIIGFTNIDEHGQEGIEKTYDDWLSSLATNKTVVKDCMGHYLHEVESNHNPSGNDLTLSVDSRLQYLAYNALQNAVQQHKAVSASAVVLDVATGEVLSMVNQPTYNPNIRNWTQQNSHTYRNRAITDAFEPGSVMKVFSLASVLTHKKLDNNMIVNTAPGFIKLNGGLVRDLENNGSLNLTNILLKSSNVGISKLVLDIGPKALCETFDQFGFGWTTESNFLGENSGYVLHPKAEQSFVTATMSFGYGMTATTLQLARAFAVLGSGGVRKPVSFIKQNTINEGIRVMPADVAKQMLTLLEASSNHPGSNAVIANYTIAGKTGTVRKLGENGYEQGKHRAVFGGLVPAKKPKFAIVVVINEPSNGAYYANQVAAPVFANIAKDALRLYNIAPDQILTKTKPIPNKSQNA